MPYLPLDLKCKNPSVALAIRMATEPTLRDVHYLLTLRTLEEPPHNDLGHSACTMTILAIAATSAIRDFDRVKNRNLAGDRASFLKCVLEFFPWAHVSVTDERGRTGRNLHKAASEELYIAARNPLVHVGGVVGAGHPRLKSVVGFERDQSLVDWCAHESLNGQEVFAMSGAEFKIYLKTFYWAARKMVEAFAADAEVQADLERNLVRKC